MKLKKRICTLFTLLIIGVLALVSCGGSSGGGSGNGSGTNNPPGDAILSSGKVVDLVYNPDVVSKETVFDLGDGIVDVTQKSPDVIYDSVSKTKNEIVIGSTSRKISADAEKRLNAMLKRAIRYSKDEDEAEDDLAAYTIYSDGESVAIVWTSDYGAAPAIAYFKENYLFGESLSLEAGYSKTVVFSITEYLAERGEKLKSEAWAKLKTQLPEENADEIMEAFKRLYSLYSPELVVWMANLYDPTVGGFYYCPSARDNEGFLPDIESTYIALSFLGASGMAEMYGGDWAAATPDWLADAVCDWVISMRDPEDGYYYHVQWPKEYIEANGFQTRITRDRGSGNSLLQAFDRYSSTASTAALNNSNRLGVSTAFAVSKAVAAADDMMWQFASTENFRTYISGLDSRCAVLGDAELAYQFYVYGNEFQSSVHLLNEEMRDILIKFFDKYQSPETGMWSKNLYYNTTNGYHKVASVYNSLGATLKYTDKAVQSTMEILCWSPEDHPTSAGVEYYNALSCLPYIYQNIRNFGSGTEEEKAGAIDSYKAIVYANAPTMILNGYAQMTAFACPDGSFGTSTYSRGNAGKAQGVPIGIPGTKEGDIGGTYVATMDIIDYTLKALELEEYKVPLFTESERYAFVKTLESLGPVIKHTEELGEHIVIDFEDAQNETDFPQDIHLTQRESTVYLEEDEYGDTHIVFETHNWYAQASTSNGRNSWFTINAPMVEQGANCGVIEVSLAFDEVYNNQNDSFMIDFQNNAYGTIASFGFKYTVEGEYAYARMYDHNENDVGFALPSGSKEIKLRMEYYKAEAVIKIYVNDVFIKETDALASQALDFNSAQFAFQGHSELTAFFDDICCERIKKAYVKEIPGVMPDFDLPVFGRANYDFEDVPVGTRFPRHLSVTANNGKAEIIRDEYASRSLCLKGVNLPLQANPRATIINYKCSDDANAYVFRSYISVECYADSESYRNVGRIQLLDEVGAEILALRIRAKIVDGDTRLVIAEKSNLDNVLATITEGVRIDLKAIYYPESKTVALYVNGELAGASYVASAGAAVNRANVVVEAGVAATLTIDNLGMTSEKVEEPAPEAPNKPDGSESSLPSAYEKPETPDGVHNFGFEGEYTTSEKELSYSDGTQSTVDELLFLDGALVRYDGGTNVHGATATVNGDENNKYLTIFAPRRVHDRDRAHGYRGSLIHFFRCEHLRLRAGCQARLHSSRRNCFT